MIATIIGISSGLIIIVAIMLLKMSDKGVIYGLILSGIGFLYVGFTWTDIHSFMIASIQAIVFLLIAYYGIKKNMYILAAGYILHGIWDLAYGHYLNSELLPPRYDLFCLSIDFVIGFYLILTKQFGPVK